jgi:hypothetical protein
VPVSTLAWRECRWCGRGAAGATVHPLAHQVREPVEIDKNLATRRYQTLDGPARRVELDQHVACSCVGCRLLNTIQIGEQVRNVLLDIGATSQTGDSQAGSAGHLRPDHLHRASAKSAQVWWRRDSSRRGLWRAHGVPE